MKFLCLHGMGCNARIFEAQSSQLTWTLKQHGHQFIFVDAIAPCDAPDDRFKSMYPPPYLAWWTTCDSEDIVAALEYLEEVIDEEGPFDGVLAFSQGCGATAALMKRYADKSAEPPFRFAVFMGAPLPQYVDETGSTCSRRDVKLTIPILHVIGKEDPVTPQSLELAGMHRDPLDSFILEHKGGHEIPRDAMANAAILKWVAKQEFSSFCC